MSNLPPIQPLPYAIPGQYHSRDEDHLRLLAIFHYVLGGLTLLLACIPFIHVAMGVMLVTGRFPQSGGSTPPPDDFGWFFIAFGAMAILLGWTIGVLTLYSARCIQRRRHRTFSLVIAALMCLNMPLGTVLGVFTLVVLLRESVAALYASVAFDPMRQQGAIR